MAKVKVNILANETVHYNQIVEMEEEEYHLLSRALEADYTATNELLFKYIDKANVSDSDGLEDGEIYIEEE